MRCKNCPPSPPGAAGPKGEAGQKRELGLKGDPGKSFHSNICEQGKKVNLGQKNRLFSRNTKVKVMHYLLLCLKLRRHEN